MLCCHWLPTECQLPRPGAPTSFPDEPGQHNLPRQSPCVERPLLAPDRNHERTLRQPREHLLCVLYRLCVDSGAVVWLWLAPRRPVSIFHIDKRPTSTVVTGQGIQAGLYKIQQQIQGLVLQV